MNKPTIIAFSRHIQKLVPKELAPGNWDLYRWFDGRWCWRDNIGQHTYDRIVDEAEDLAEHIDQASAMRTENNEGKQC